jgi:UDP-glucuronate 4-epimerase
MAYFRIATSLLTDSKFELFGDGSIRRDFTYINDAVDCVSLLVNQLLTENPGFSDIVNLGGGKPASMLDLIGVSESISGKKLQYSISLPNSSDVSMTYSDNSYLRQLVGRVPTTTVEDGMTQFINWCLRPDIRERLQNWITGTL